MAQKGLISKTVPVLKKDGEWVRNPLVITDRYIDDGAIVYGEMLQGGAAKAAKELIKECEVDFTLLDNEVNSILWKLTNLMPHCLQMSIDGIRQKKKFFWDLNKNEHRHWLAANMVNEAYLGFNAFNYKKLTGQGEIDFIKYRQLLAEAKPMTQELIDTVMPQRKE